MFRIPLPLAPRRLRWVGVIGVTSIIVYFSLVTTVPEPPTGSGVIWDKKLHFAAYAGFAFTLAYATVEYRSRRMLRGGCVLGIALAFGFGIELAQGVLPMRYYSRVDLLANLLGTSLVFPWFVLERRVRYVRLPFSERLERDGRSVFRQRASSVAGLIRPANRGSTAWTTVAVGSTSTVETSRPAAPPSTASSGRRFASVSQSAKASAP